MKQLNIIWYIVLLIMNKKKYDRRNEYEYVNNECMNNEYNNRMIISLMMRLFWYNIGICNGQSVMY